MKTIKKESVSYYNVFVAIDGTEFTNEDECKKYEATAYGVLSARYQKLIINTDTEDNVFVGIGSDDRIVEAVRINSQTDADTVMQMYLLINPHLDKDNRWLKRADSLINRALEEKDILLVGRYANECEYKENFWIDGTANSIKEGVDEFLTTEKNA